MQWNTYGKCKLPKISQYIFWMVIFLLIISQTMIKQWVLKSMSYILHSHIYSVTLERIRIYTLKRCLIRKTRQIIWWGNRKYIHGRMLAQYVMWLLLDKSICWYLCNEISIRSRTWLNVCVGWQKWKNTKCIQLHCLRNINLSWVICWSWLRSARMSCKYILPINWKYNFSLCKKNNTHKSICALTTISSLQLTTKISCDSLKFNHSMPKKRRWDFTLHISSTIFVFSFELQRP